jgi:hypothetical protein
MDRFTKQSYEAFTISVDFGTNMEEGETIVSQTVEAIDTLDADSLAIVVDDALTTNDGATKVFVYVRAGDETLSPYKITVKCVTSANHKWEKDIEMEVEEI